jgi:poly(A) polymerase
MMLRAVADILRRRRTEGWLVGGSVRDRYLGRYSPDLDVVVADDPADVARQLAIRLSSPWFALSARHGAYRVMGPDGHVDVALMRGAGIVDDLAQRDFTINAMALPLGEGTLVDPFLGLEHLSQGRLVAVSERIFEDDPLRLMRGPRFCHLLGLKMDPSLETLIRARASVLVRAAPERVATEMALTLDEGRSSTAAQLWQELGLLAIVLPEVVAAERLTPTVAALERLDDMMAHLEAWFPESAGAVAERLAQPVDGALRRPVALRLAGLMHRLPPQDAVTAGRGLKLSVATISLLGTVSACFHRGRCSSGALQKAALSDRSAVLFLWNAAPWEPELIMLAAAAAASPGGAPAPPATAAAPRRLMALWADRALRGVPRPPIDGEVLMRDLDLTAGPLVGEVLREVRLAWEAGEATTGAEALIVARGALREARTGPESGS